MNKIILILAIFINTACAKQYTCYKIINHNAENYKIFRNAKDKYSKSQGFFNTNKINCSEIYKWSSEYKKVQLTKKEIGTNKNSVLPDRSKIANLIQDYKNTSGQEKEIYSLTQGIKPFSQEKWHTSPLDVLTSLCQKSSIEEISFDYYNHIDTLYNNTTPKVWLNKDKVCNNINSKKLFNYIINNSYISDSYIWKRIQDKLVNVAKTNIDKQKNKYIFKKFGNDHEMIIYFSTKYVSLGGIKYIATYKFSTNKDIVVYLFLEDKDRLHNYYFTDKNNNIYYTYYALEEVKLQPAGNNLEQDLYDMKYDKLANAYRNKYKKYFMSPGNNNFIIGDPLNGAIYLKKYSIIYKYPINNLFKGYYRKMLSELENNNSEVENIDQI